MARGVGVSQGFSLKDQLFNAESLRDLAEEYGRGIDGFDADEFHTDVVAGLQGRELMERLEWIADCVQARLSDHFPTMADQLESAMPPPLDPTLADDDFGRFIHAVPGILAVRHGLEDHRERSLNLLYEATQRFSMEFYIRPFLNRWPEETFQRLHQWAEDENYHVRRLVSEGTRPKLPWAKKVDIDLLSPLPLLDKLYGDPTRYVTRSVANHLNDISKTEPDVVTDRLKRWQAKAQQAPKELGWMTRHALRTAVKSGHEGALALLGFHADAPVTLSQLTIKSDQVAIGGALEFELALATQSEADVAVMVDYEMRFFRPNGRGGKKIFKLKQSVVPAGGQLVLQKRHLLKGNATTFKLHPGPHSLAVQINGRQLGEISFDVISPS
ncbi:DNA alkylation repair protein [Shimia haliotis]|uniref:3-methyladenine DNA glycosylase AlkC n=1 Tax=Shimia haliotis TaxID=1280847 RepID=A0A1I4AE99_9RHOB|nr:DNA alkylation repair protein [Shimia haliotis]SFK54728.1 3-methyladenine DNA glycosylase AlkC [Shimia haliotis]